MTTVSAPNVSQVLPANLLTAAATPFLYVEKSTPGTSNLQWLTYGRYELNGRVTSSLLAHVGEEALLFGWKGRARVELADRSYEIGPYDVLYLPRDMPYRLAQESGEARVVICRAPAVRAHPVFHARWVDVSKDERRIRRLKGKTVYLMFDVSEGADKLMAGFTLFEPHQRSWPPHNHTDQEEVYIFTRGKGAMEVYADEETKSFVHSVAEGDGVTIPVRNYHPVFSQDEELDFIWCIAGNRYWVGDKNKDFISGKVDKLTT